MTMISGAAGSVKRRQTGVIISFGVMKYFGALSPSVPAVGSFGDMYLWYVSPVNEFGGDMYLWYVSPINPINVPVLV